MSAQGMPGGGTEHEHVGCKLKGGSRHVKQQITLAMPDCRRNWGSCVDFPLPVSPTSIVVSCVRMSCKSSWRTSAIGRRLEASCNALAFLPLACSDMNHNSVALTLALVWIRLGTICEQKSAKKIGFCIKELFIHSLMAGCMSSA